MRAGPASVPVEVCVWGEAFVPSLALFLSVFPILERLQTAFIVLPLVGFSVL